MVRIDDLPARGFYDRLDYSLAEVVVLQKDLLCS